jgi:hypothetical protein
MARGKRATHQMTYISYPNIVTTSENGRWRVEIRGRKEGESFRDRSNFVYRLLDNNQAGRVVWKWRPQGEDGIGDFPHQAWVSDQAWTVVRLHHWFGAGLLVLSPDGNKHMLHPLQSIDKSGREILDDESDVHMGGGSAGPSWEASSIAYFHSFENKPFWSIRTWWGRRILIDLEQGEFIRCISPDHGEWMDVLERSHVLDELTQAVPLLQSRLEKSQWLSRTTERRGYAAAFMAGALEIEQAIPWLRQLENNKIVGGSTSESWLNIRFLPFRLIAKISLLKLGREPTWRPNLLLREAQTKCKLQNPKKSYARSIDSFRIGLSQRELLESIGAPEFMRPTWDYCFVGPSTKSVRVHWHDQHRHLFGDFRYPISQETFKAYRDAIHRAPPTIEKIEYLDQHIWQADSRVEYSIAHSD